MDTQSRWYAGLKLFLLLFLLGVQMRVMAVADPQTPDADLLARARVAIAQNQYTDANALLEQIRQQFPKSESMGEATVLLLQNYLVQGNTPGAQALWADVPTRWAKTDIATRMVEVYFTGTIGKDPQSALTWLASVLQQDVLTPGGRYRAELLRYHYEQQTAPPQFLAEALTVLQAKKATTMPEEVLFLADLASRVYPPLLNAGKYDDAKGISAYIQEIAMQQGNPNRVADVDLRALLSVLAQTDPAHFLSEAMPVVSRYKTATTTDAMVLPVEFAARLEENLMMVGRFDEANTLHEGVLGAIVKLGNPNNWAESCTEQYQASRLNVLERTAPDQFINEALQKINEIEKKPEITTPIVLVVSDLGRRSYGRLLQAGRYIDAMNTYAQVQKICMAAKRIDLAQANEATYVEGFQRALDRGTSELLLTDIDLWLTDPAVVLDPSNVQRRVELARRVYGLFCGAGRQKEAREIYDHLQDIITKSGTLEQAQENGTRYLSGCAEQLPTQQAYTEAITVLTRRADKTSLAEVNILLSLANRTYSNLCDAKHFDDVKTQHDTVQSLLTAFGRPELMPTDTLQYLDIRLRALEQQQPDRFVLEALTIVNEMTKTPDTATMINPNFYER